MGQFRSTGDLELLRAVAEDPTAFGELYCRHVLAIERWLRSQTSDRAVAADLTAETFAQALVSLHRFHGDDDDAPRAWLFGIARNLVRRYRRRGKVELATVKRLGLTLVPEEDELVRVEETIDAASYAPELATALDELPDTQRQALELRVVDELDYRHAAALMGTNEQNARIRVSRALKTLSLRLQGASK